MPHAAPRRPLYLAQTTLLDAPPLVLIDAAACAGYAGVGLRLHASPNMPFHPVVGQPQLIRDIEYALGDTGLGVLDALSFYLQPDFTVDAVLPALELAARFGARFTLVQGDDPEPARLQEHFVMFCQAATHFGLGAALEFVPSRPLATLQHAVALLAATRQANARILVDTLHLVRSGGTAADLAAVDPALLGYAQVSDGLLGPGEPDLSLLGRMPLGQRCLAGSGVLPLAEILGALPGNLPLSVEVLQPTTGADAALDARSWARLTRATTVPYLT